MLFRSEKRILEVLKHEKDWDKLKITIHHASQVIGMDEHPADAVRTKKDSSVVVATRLVKEGECDAVLSAGSTGAAVTAAQLILKRIRGIGRPTIATPIPTPKGVTLMLDSGANVDSKPIHLVQSGMMGSLYAEYVLGIKKPKVGLLNIGEEETKGNEQVKETYPLLKAMHTINFCGNAEGRDIPNSKRSRRIVCTLTSSCFASSSSVRNGLLLTASIKSCCRSLFLTLAIRTPPLLVPTTTTSYNGLL